MRARWAGGALSPNRLTPPPPLLPASSDATEAEDAPKAVLRYDVQRVDAVLSALQAEFPEGEQPAAVPAAAGEEEGDVGLLGGGASWLRAAATGSAEPAAAAAAGGGEEEEKKEPALAMADSLLAAVLDVAGRSRGEGAPHTALMALDEFSDATAARV